MAVRTAEVIYVGDAASLIKANEAAAASTSTAADTIARSNVYWSASARAAAQVAQESAAKTGASMAEQAAAASAAAKKQAEAMGASAAEQEVAAKRAADAAVAASIRQEAAATTASHAWSHAAAGLAVFAGALYGIKHGADVLAGITHETLALHNVTGLSTQSASAYAAVAQTQELSVKQLNQAFGTLSKNVQAVVNAHEGLTKAAKAQEIAFRELGLPFASIVKAHGDLNQLMPEVIARFEEHT